MDGNQRRALRYELSFPPDNFQGVAFEPWHWRFVGDRTSLETFYSE
jgi:D-alanyl-D-alanine carboxypeptidase